MAEIVRRAGVAQGTFYRYFSSKTHLVSALTDLVQSEMLQAFRRILEENPDQPLVNNIEAILRTAFTATVGYGDLLRMLNLQITIFGETNEAEMRREPFLTLMEQVIIKNQEQGWLNLTYNPFMLARLINSSFTQLVLDCLVYHPEIDQETYITQAAVFLSRALALSN